VRKLLLVTALVSILLIGIGVAIAASPGTQGQPGESCQTTTVPPSPQATSAPGSPFNASGMSGSVYANGTASGRPNDTATSQYDVACFQATHRP
jgi:hypothetical protein